MTSMNLPTFTLSIETDAGTYQHGFHLGTDERLARKLTVERFAAQHPRQGTKIKTIALKADGKLVDFYDGEWLSDFRAEVNDTSYEDEAVRLMEAQAPKQKIYLVTFFPEGSDENVGNPLGFTLTLEGAMAAVHADWKKCKPTYKSTDKLTWNLDTGDEAVEARFSCEKAHAYLPYYEIMKVEEL
jgi:hypothetical protein